MGPGRKMRGGSQVEIDYSRFDPHSRGPAIQHEIDNAAKAVHYVLSCGWRRRWNGWHGGGNGNAGRLKEGLGNGLGQGAAGRR